MKAYLSYLRIISTFAVVILHVVAFYVLKFEEFPFKTWNIAHLIDSCIRFCVPVFLMISGALLLDKDEKLELFLTKRFKRILVPFLFWSVIYFIYQNWGISFTKNWKIISENFYFELMKGVSFHFWYVYMILGIYLFVPILRRWTMKASNNELLYFLGIWTITLFINPENSNYFPKIEFLYFSKYIGYLVLGFYLSKLEIKSVAKTRIFSLLILFLGIFLTYFLTLQSTIEKGSFDKFFYEYLSPNVTITAIGIFIFFKTLTLKTNNFTIAIDKNTFGIYLIHLLILEIIKTQIPDSSFLGNQFFFFLYIMLISILVFLVSYLAIFTLSKIPFLKKIIT